MSDVHANVRPFLAPRASSTGRIQRLGIGILGGMILLAAAAPALSPYGPSELACAAFEKPSLAHPLGCDDAGHDLLAQVLYGARISLFVGLMVASLATALAAGLAVLVGVYGGWVDRLVMRAADVVLKDRRKLVLVLSTAGAGVLALPVLFDLPFALLLVVGALAGGISNPLYSLLLAYVNDYLDRADMAAASAGLIFINGLGAISGPIITGWMMGAIGPAGFFLFMALIFGVLALYAAWRMTQRRVVPGASGGYAALSPTASALTVEAALDAAESDTRR